MNGAESRPTSPSASSPAKGRGVAKVTAMSDGGLAPSGVARRVRSPRRHAEQPVATPQERTRVVAKNDTFLAKGKRGEVFLRTLRGTTVLVKRRNPSAAVDTISNEAKHTALLNEHGVGPRFISYDPVAGELVREYVEGEEFRKWLPAAVKKDVLPVLVSVFEQCKVMDDLDVVKEEMTRPWKHIIITNNKKALLIDFERCRDSSLPKNVTQYCQFLCGTRIGIILKSKEIIINNKKLLSLAKKYKQNIKNNNRDANATILRKMIEAVTHGD